MIVLLFVIGYLLTGLACGKIYYTIDMAMNAKTYGVRSSAYKEEQHFDRCVAAWMLPLWPIALAIAIVACTAYSVYWIMSRPTKAERIDRRQTELEAAEKKIDDIYRQYPELGPAKPIEDKRGWKAESLTNYMSRDEKYLSVPEWKAQELERMKDGYNGL